MITGNYAKFGSAPLLCTSMLHYVVTFNCEEVKNVALSACTKKVVWLRRLLYGIYRKLTKFADQKLCLTSMYTDNPTVICQTKSPQLLKRIRGVGIKIYHVEEFRK